MAHTIEPAPSGRARCRGCGQAIDKNELRFGERLPNPFAEGEMTHWFHLACAAYRRPEPFLEALTITSAVEGSAGLEAEARRTRDHRRLSRLNGAMRAPSGRASCRSCREPIAKGAWRIPLVFYDEGRFQPSGFVHVRCAGSYFETTDLVPRILHFSPQLTEEEVAEIRIELAP